MPSNAEALELLREAMEGADLAWIVQEAERARELDLRLDEELAKSELEYLIDALYTAVVSARRAEARTLQLVNESRHPASPRETVEVRLQHPVSEGVGWTLSDRTLSPESLELETLLEELRGLLTE